LSNFVLLRGQSVRWRMTMLSGTSPANMTGGTWGVAESAFLPANLPTFENNGTEAWLIWTPMQTANMKTGRKKLRLKFTQANGDVKVFPDLFITVQ
jgi:hypothetical protein